MSQPFDLPEFATVEMPGSTQAVSLPVAWAFDAQGNPVPMQIDRSPLNCGHEGSQYSSNLDVRCPRCGAPMFLPATVLANIDRATIDEMDRIWSDAGWPEYRRGEWATVPTHWTYQSHPLFANVGGIPVRTDKLAQWLEKYGFHFQDMPGAVAAANPANLAGATPQSMPDNGEVSSVPDSPNRLPVLPVGCIPGNLTPLL